MCPAASSRLTSAWPDVSSASVRVSETVRTAIRTGIKGREASIPGIVCNLVLALIQGLIFRPLAARDLVEARQILLHAVAVNPEVRQHALDKNACLPAWQGFDKEKRVVAILRCRLPLFQIPRPAVIGRG